jgi:hypothetical protein
LNTLARVDNIPQIVYSDTILVTVRSARELHMLGEVWNSLRTMFRRAPKPAIRRLQLEVLENRWVATLVANNDAYSVLHDQVLHVNAATGVLANDSSTSGPLTVTGYTQPNYGTVSVNSDGSFDFTPPTAWIGGASFNYTVTDGTDTATSTVSINVTDQAPVAVNQS